MSDSDAGITQIEWDLVDHPAVEAWRRLSGDCVEFRQIEVLRERKSGGGVYRLQDDQGRSLIAKRSTRAAAETERFVYQEILPSVSASALGCYGTVADADPEFCWLFLEDAGSQGYSSEILEHRVLAGKWLGSMHVASQRFSKPAELSARGPDYYLWLLRMSRDVLLANMSASLTSEQGKLLRATVALLDQFETSWDRVMGLCEGLPSTLVHDDLATKNVRIREHRGGLDLTVMDWESAGWGNPAVDLTQFMGGVLTPDLTSYASAVRECWAFEPADLARFSAAGACFRILNGLAWTNWGFRPESITWYLSEIRWYEERLREWVDTRKSKK